jgi:hypothetical protein
MSEKQWQADDWDYPLFINLIESTEKVRIEVNRLKSDSGRHGADGGYEYERRDSGVA